MPIHFNPCTIFRLKRNGKLAMIVFEVVSCWIPLPTFMIEDEDGKTGVIPYDEIGDIDWDTVLCLHKNVCENAKKMQLAHGIVFC